MRIAIITGASSGIGREFARQIPKLYRQLDENMGGCEKYR